ncbi:MAG: thioesterase family protein [Tetrasphaera sp.]
METRLSYRVYLEDTDQLGVVYYANYFKYFERGRSEWLTAVTGHAVASFQQSGILLVVHKVTATFRKPALLWDTIDVVSSFTVESPYRGQFKQRVERAGELLVDAVIDLVALDTNQNLVELPPQLRVTPGA